MVKEKRTSRDRERRNKASKRERGYLDLFRYCLMRLESYSANVTREGRSFNDGKYGVRQRMNDS